jgi:hypothetical protein
MDKEYKIGEDTYKINGTEELHTFIDKVLTENIKLSQQPSLTEQLALWDKAKPHYEAKQLKIDYNQPAIEVMKACLDGQYDVTDADDTTIKYLFNKMLQAPATKDSTSTNTDTTPAKTPAKPNVPPSKGNDGKSSEEMGDIMLQRRLSGQIEANGKR